LETFISAPPFEFDLRKGNSSAGLGSFSAGGLNFPFSVEAVFDAAEDAGEVWLGDAVVDLATFPFAKQETAALHQPQMLGGHVAVYSAGFGKLTDGVPATQQHLDDAEAVGVGQRFEAFGGPFEGGEGS
jgi:hypothetical protein